MKPLLLSGHARTAPPVRDHEGIRQPQVIFADYSDSGAGYLPAAWQALSGSGRVRCSQAAAGVPGARDGGVATSPFACMVSMKTSRVSADGSQPISALSFSFETSQG